MWDSIRDPGGHALGPRQALTAEPPLEATFYVKQQTFRDGQRPLLLVHRCAPVAAAV